MFLFHIQNVAKFPKQFTRALTNQPTDQPLVLFSFSVNAAIPSAGALKILQRFVTLFVIDNDK